MSRRTQFLSATFCVALLIGALAAGFGRSDDSGKGPSTAADAAATQIDLAAEPGPKRETEAEPSPFVDLAAPLKAAAENEQRIRRALQKKVTVAFEETPLNDAVPHIGKLCGVQTVFDAYLLLDYGIPLDQPVSLKLTEALPAAAALTRLLEPHGLEWTVNNEMLTVTVQGEGDVLDTRQYNVQTLLRAGYSAAVLVDVIEQETSGPWIDIHGIGGTVLAIGQVLLIRQNEQVHRDVTNLLPVLERVATGSEKTGAILLIDPADREVYKVLSRKVSDDFRNTPLKDVADFLSDRLKVNFLIDEPRLQEEGIAVDDPVTVRFNDVTLVSALKLILQPLGLTYYIDDGAFMITTEIDADEKLFTAVFNVRDFVEAEYDVLSLVDAIQGQTTGPWIDVDGAGGTITDPIPGTLIVRQTWNVLQETAMLLDELRATLKEETPGGRLPKIVDGPDGMVVKHYFITSLPIEDVRDAIPKFVAPVSWKASGGEGELAMVESMIVVRQTHAVHRQIERFLRTLRNQTNFGGLGYGNGGGFFHVD